jgi:hypothetical protein
MQTAKRAVFAVSLQLQDCLLYMLHQQLTQSKRQSLMLFAVFAAAVSQAEAVLVRQLRSLPLSGQLSSVCCISNMDSNRQCTRS